MDRSPGGCLGPSVDHDFSPDELEVATALPRLKYLIPLYHFRNCGFVTPLWGSKRHRSAYGSAVAPSSTCPLPDRLRTQSRVTAKYPVVSGGGNRRNISPDSPLLLKDSPLSSGMHGSSGTVAEPPPEKMEKMEAIKVEEEGTVPEDLLVQVDVSLTLRGQRSDSQLPSDRSSVSYPLPNGGAYASPGSPSHASRPRLLFDLNIVPPDCMAIQSPLRDEDGEPGLPPYNVAAAEDGITKAEKAKSARQKRIAVRRDQISKAKRGFFGKAHSASRH